MKYLISILVFLFILSGCSGKPSNNEIKKKVIENLLSDGFEEILTIENFEKTNGYEKDSQTYVAVVKYEIVFQKGLQDLSKQLRKEYEGSLLGPMQADAITMALEMQYGNFKEGYRVKKDEQFTFIKAESGWLIEEK